MKYIIGKTEVNAWKIVTFYLMLDDYFVQGQPVVTRTGHVTYSSPAVPSIISARDFVNTYTPIPEPAPEPAAPALRIIADDMISNRSYLGNYIDNYRK